MRKTIAFTLGAALLGILQAGPAAAAPPITSSEFATLCSSGPLTVAGRMTVTGGTGELTADCFITMRPGAVLSFENATLTSDTEMLIVADSQIKSALNVTGSTIDLGGAVQLATGCCAGGGEPGRNENRTSVSVIDSVIIGETVEVSGSIAANLGTALVQNSTLEATSSSSFSLSVLASVAGTGGSATVTNSTLSTPGGIHIETGTAGTTTATGNTFSAGSVTISAGSGGTCTSAGNTPSVSCT